MLPSYTSSNGHKVSQFGRLLYLVTSASRENLKHLVDIEPCEDYKSFCSCESYNEGGIRPCRHILASCEAFAHWCGIPDENLEEFTARMIFLIHMGCSIKEALQTDRLKALRGAKFLNPIVQHAAEKLHLIETGKPSHSEPKRRYQLKTGRKYQHA